MDLLALLNDLVAKLQDFQAKVEELKAQLADAQAQLDLVKKAAFDEGFAAGVASVPAGDPEKKFTQADLDAAVQSAVAALKADLVAKLDAFEASENQLAMDLKAQLL